MNAGNLIRRALKQVKSILRGKRNHRLLLLKRMPRSAVCAEIGVWKGDFSMRIQQVTSPKKLHLIDPWEFQNEYPKCIYGGSVAKNQMEMNHIFQKVENKFKNYPNVIIHRGRSEKVLQKFEDGYFDWIYIDGNHHYEYVLKDLRLSLSRIKSGGIIAGDDYTWRDKEGFPVKRAVQYFVEENKLESNLKIFGTQFIIKL